jgi:hypothetical protein
MIVKAGLAWWMRSVFKGNQTLGRLWEKVRGLVFADGGRGRKRRDSETPVQGKEKKGVVGDERLPHLSLDDRGGRSSLQHSSVVESLRTWSDSASNFLASASSSVMKSASSRRSKVAFD